MACIDNETSNRNYILETVKSIDRMQKDIIIDRLGDCITCETSLISISYNTVPVSFYMCNGNVFEAFYLTAPFNQFRIESIRDNRYVVLRVIDSSATPVVCTNQTAILDLECVCGMQCYAALNCQLCSEAE